MAESSLAVTAGSGTNLRTNTRTISATTVHEQGMMLAYSNASTYTAIATDTAVATSADHVLYVQGDGTNYCRLVSCTIEQSTLAGAVGTLDLRIYRTSTAGTGGTTINCRPFDAADTDPFGGTAMTLPTAKGTEGNLLDQFRLGIVAANPMDSRNRLERRYDSPYAKPIIWGTATSSGIVLKVVTGVATVKIDVIFTFAVTSYL